MQRITDEVWPGSYLTDGDDLDALKAQRQLGRSWGGELGKEAVEVFTVPINHYNFFSQFKGFLLASYLFDTWTELEGTLYDNHLTVSGEADYAGVAVSFYLIKYDDIIVGYTGKGNKEETCQAHINSRFEIRSKASL